MKIDYDELRRDAVAFIESNKIASFYTFSSIPPEKMLRLLKIIDVAKQRLRNIWNIDGFDDHNGAFLEAVVALDEIDKLERGE